MNKDMRVVRVPLSVELIRRLDQIILSGKGGFETRHEFIQEAIEAMIMEVSHDVVENIGEYTQWAPDMTEREACGPSERHETGGLEFTILLLPDGGCKTVTAPIGGVNDKPLFGLHNRDYPSLWSAVQLAYHTRQQLIPFDEFKREVTNSAWRFADKLEPVKSPPGQKLNALFPKNREKKQATEAAFQAFAIGECTDDGKSVRCDGPLFVWRLCQVERVGGLLHVGLTRSGIELLGRLDGISLDLPHSAEHARTFFSYLRDNAMVDWEGFEVLLDAVDDGVTREELANGFRNRYADWTEAQVSTNTAGYVARAREWGLLKTKQVSGRYELTDVGFEMRERK